MATKQEAQNRNPDHRQDRTNPFLINVETGMLLPNTPLLRRHPKMRLYTADTDLPLDERMRWLSGATKRAAAPKVINSVEEESTFDMGRATKDEIIAFAYENFAVTLPSALSVKQLRAELARLAAAAETEDLAA